MKMVHEESQPSRFAEERYEHDEHIDFVEIDASFEADKLEAVDVGELCLNVTDDMGSSPAR